MPISRRRLLKLAASGVAAGYAPMPAFASIAEPQAAQQVESGAKKIIRLDRNENAYGPSPKAIAEILKNAGSVNRFPDSTDALVSSLAGLHKVKPEEILLGAGSTAIIKMAMDIFLRNGRK